MAVTGRGDFPLRSTWVRGRTRYKGSLAPILKSVFAAADEDTTEVTILADWFFPASFAAYVLTAQGGAYSWTGASATLLRNRVLTAQGGAYT